MRGDFGRYQEAVGDISSYWGQNWKSDDLFRVYIAVRAVLNIFEEM